MKKSVCFKKLPDGIEVYFDSCFPNEIKIALKQGELMGLARLLCRMGKNKRGFVWKTRARSDVGDFVFKITGAGVPSLTFEYKMFNAPLESVSDCENYYDRISFEGVLQFGNELLDLENKKEAVLYECTPLPRAPFFKEYANKP